jgi:predicted metalloenzyme YecM
MAYVDTTELARVLKIRDPSDAQEAAMDRCLEAATAEIDKELGLETGLTSASDIALVEQVNLERAAELWKLQEVQFGQIIGSELVTGSAPRDTWKKHAITLAPLKETWGFA